MNIRKYSNVIADAKEDPKFQQYCDESLARLRLAEAIDRERVAQQLTIKQLAEVGCVPRTFLNSNHRILGFLNLRGLGNLATPLPTFPPKKQMR